MIDQKPDVGGMSALPPKFQISRDEIAGVVATFYERIRQHPGLGPVFAVHVDDWPAHEAKVTDFWANAILNERVYDGSPMAAHVQAGNVRPGMFETWLSLFDKVLAENLTIDQAAAWSALAHRIGRSLRAGVVERATLPGGIPKLR
ncbi:group III truncated hemoglobin [Actibacterium mucosum]|nr:group III truncated hemoglobin [Actibacterium mucosum]